MLVALRVEQLILIDGLELRLNAGCNALTGETGAGKSIVVGALDLVLGRRASADVVRPGAAQAEVEALFDLSADEALLQRLDKSGIACDGELVIRRVIQHSGRSRAYLNGRLCAARELTALAPELADITSQHESAAIADPKRHIDYLDRYAELGGRRRELGTMVDGLLERSVELDELRELERGRAEREAFLHYQLEAIDGVSPEPGELDELGAERSRLRHAEQLRTIAAGAAERLDRGEGALCDELGRLSAELSTGADLDPTLESAAHELEDCWGRLREVGAQVARYAERLESDPARLDEVQDRIYRLEQLLRQHGPRVEDVLEARSRIHRALEQLDSASGRLPELERQQAEALREAGKLARRLSARREKAGQKLSRAISAVLAELGMGRARVVVEVSPATARHAQLRVGDARLRPTGIDRVQFLIAPNEGAEPRPLGRIASGGELSRALLALKHALGTHAATSAPGKRGTGIQVFDEVDAGVGGATADRIGRCIAGIADHRQVLCITHLAPIAAYAEAHFVVSKQEQPGRTTSRIERVEKKSRVAELARMLSGAEITASSTKAAAELLQTTKRWRRS